MSICLTQPREDVIGTATTKNGRRPSIQTTELQNVSQRLGKLAVARFKQAGQFRIRQQEQLRRALQTAAQALDWDVIASLRERPMEDLAVDVQRLTRAGLRALERDLDAEIAEKRQEVRRLKRTVAELSELAEEDDESAFPAEVVYQYTSSQGKGVFVTKEEELQIEDPDSAEAAAVRLEKRIDRIGRLRDQMIEALKQRKQIATDAKAEIREFVRGTRPLVREVLATIP